MSTDHPTLAEQIDAVEWAELYALEIASRRDRRRRRSGYETVRRRLEAAVETLRTLEYGSAIAR